MVVVVPHHEEAEEEALLPVAAGEEEAVAAVAAAAFVAGPHAVGDLPGQVVAEEEAPPVWLQLGVDRLQQHVVVDPRPAGEDRLV